MESATRIRDEWCTAKAPKETESSAQGNSQGYRTHKRNLRQTTPAGYRLLVALSNVLRGLRARSGKNISSSRPHLRKQLSAILIGGDDTTTLVKTLHRAKADAWIVLNPVDGNSTDSELQQLSKAHDFITWTDGGRWITVSEAQSLKTSGPIIRTPVPKSIHSKSRKPKNAESVTEWRVDGNLIFFRLGQHAKASHPQPNLIV